MKEMLDIFFNSQFVGTLEADETATKETLLKPAEQHFPRRTVTIRKVVHVPHKNLSFFEKTAE